MQVYVGSLTISVIIGRCMSKIAHNKACRGPYPRRILTVITGMSGAFWWRYQEMRRLSRRRVLPTDPIPSFLLKNWNNTPLQTHPVILRKSTHSGPGFTAKARLTAPHSTELSYSPPCISYPLVDPSPDNYHKSPKHSSFTLTAGSAPSYVTRSTRILRLL